MAGYLTTHVLDTARGVPAQGVRIELYRIEENSRRKIADAVTNEDGRTDAPILPQGQLESGQFELVFFAGDYLAAQGLVHEPAETRFLDSVPIRFGIADPQAHYHVPLLLSPFGYSTYRGS